MPFRFKNASCVVVGTFNMYIVQPPWLAEIGILDEGTPVIIGSKLDEPGFRFSSPKLATRWLVTPHRIKVETESATEDCGRLVAMVLEKLPWTPLAGIGNNTLYTAPLAELGTLTEQVRNSSEAPSGYSLSQRTHHVAVAQVNRTYNLQLSITQEEIELAVNVHVDLQGKKKKESTAIAQDSARQFFHDRQQAESLVEHFFKVRIDHANRHGKPA